MIIVAFLFFIQSGKSMIHHNSDFFCDICNAINEDNWREPDYCSSIPNYSKLLEWFKKVFHNFIYSIINHDFYVITFRMHYTLLIIIGVFTGQVKQRWILLEKIKMITLKGSMTSLKQNNYFHGQSFAKYIWNFLGFTKNLTLK